MKGRLNRNDPDGFVDLLQREAARDRPVYSSALHGRLLRQLPMERRVRSMIPATEPLPRAARRAGWLRLVGAAAVAALVATVVVVVEPRPDRVAAPPRSVAAAQPGADVADPVDAEALGIDRVPTFDELDAGVREGVSTLAATLLDVPDWRLLADFDAAGFLGMEAGR